MDDTKIIETLKELKKLKDENKQRVEKVRNIDLEKKKQIINCIVNIEIVEKLINDGILFDPRGDSSKLVWMDNNNIELSLIDAVKLLRSKLDTQ